MKQVLEFIKTHTAALACAVVALVALVAYFVYPIPAWFGDLQTQVDARGEVFSTLDGLQKASRKLPHVDATVTESPALERFPTDRIVKSGEEALQRLTDQSNQVLAAIVKANQQQLLVPNALPKPTSLSSTQFLVEYKRATAQYGEDAPKGIIATKLKGSLPPTQAELEERLNAATNRILKSELQIDGAGRPVNQVQVDQKIAEMKAKLPLEERVRRALTSQIYVSPGAVDVIPELATGTRPPDVSLVFNGQFSIWVQSAVFGAIANANGSAENVLSSPVKHLVRLNMPMSILAASGGGSPFFNPGGGEDPNATAIPELKPDASIAITPNYTANPLGYSNNSFYDPISVQLTLRVDVRRLTEALAAMQSGQLLKIKNVNFTTVDMGRALQEGYVYDKDGTTPMVEVVLDCDVLLLRSWLVKYMPDAAKQHFSQLANPTPVQ